MRVISLAESIAKLMYAFLLVLVAIFEILNIDRQVDIGT